MCSDIKVWFENRGCFSGVFYICFKARTWKTHMTKTSGAEEKVASPFCTGDVGEAELLLALLPDPGTYMYM